MKKIELKQIIGYLAFGLKVKTDSRGIFDISGFSILKKGQISLKTNNTHLDFLECVTPILRPISDLTKPMKHKGIVEFIPAEYFRADIEVMLKNNDIDFDSIPHAVILKLLEWGFDIYGLIPTGLAIDINTLNN